MTGRASLLRSGGGLAASWQALRDRFWLSDARALVYARLVAAGALVLGAALLAIYPLSAWHDPGHRPLSCDFNAFWSAARLAWRGQAAAAYHMPALLAQESAAAQPPPDGRVLPFMYPPPFLLLCLPLAALPYAAALAAFVGGGLAAFVAALRAILPRAWPLLPLLGFPGAVINAASTQNGCFSAACFATAMLQLERRPLLAGAVLGLFACKPQLGLPIPVALLAARRWRAIGGCAASAAGLALTSRAVLGGQAWAAFRAAAPASVLIGQDPHVWRSGMSTYAAGLILGAGPAWAAILQGSAVLASLAWLWRVAARRPGAGAEMAAMVCAALLCTPYLMDYDLVCRAVPMAWLCAEAARSGGHWRAWERAALAAAYPSPLAARVLAVSAGVPATPLVVAALFAVVGTRGLAPRPAAPGPHAA